MSVFFASQNSANRFKVATFNFLSVKFCSFVFSAVLVVRKRTCKHRQMVPCCANTVSFAVKTRRPVALRFCLSGGVPNPHFWGKPQTPVNAKTAKKKGVARHGKRTPNPGRIKAHGANKIPRHRRVVSRIYQLYCTSTV